VSFSPVGESYNITALLLILDVRGHFKAGEREGKGIEEKRQTGRKTTPPREINFLLLH